MSAFEIRKLILMHTNVLFCWENNLLWVSCIPCMPLFSKNVVMHCEVFHLLIVWLPHPSACIYVHVDNACVLNSWYRKLQILNVGTYACVLLLWSMWLLNSSRVGIVYVVSFCVVFSKAAFQLCHVHSKMLNYLPHPNFHVKISFCIATSTVCLQTACVHHTSMVDS